MKFGFREVCLDHDAGPHHPERPERIHAIRRRLSGRHGVSYVSPPAATRAEAAAAHAESYLDDLEAFCADGGGRWDADTVASEATWDAALASAGLANWAGEAALEGADGRDTPFALCRPPGHHAVTDDAMGFCFLNNVAIAACAAIRSGDAERVAILDWDVHHGNGTQEVFYERGDVFYASLHEHEIYPGAGHVDETGRGEGESTTMNVPLPPGSSGGTYLAALSRVVGPAIAAFDPDLLLVSAGFDAHEHDPISRMRVSTEGFGCLTREVCDIGTDAGADLAFALEGGYELDTLAESVAMVHEVFDGYEPTVERGDLDEDAAAVLDRVRAQEFPGL